MSKSYGSAEKKAASSCKATALCHGGKKTDREMSLLVDQMGKNDFPDLAKQ